MTVGQVKLPTVEQQRILDEQGNVVVLASPGSGKTFTLANKISAILQECQPFTGVAAISYTNKASQELRERALRGGTPKRGSFFGTIDKFSITEILLPFGRQTFGKPEAELQVKPLKELSSSVSPIVKAFCASRVRDSLPAQTANELRSLFRRGIVPLEAVGHLSLLVLKSSKACRDYLKARYSHIIIDEYQDSGIEQHLLFHALVDLGLTGIAVGDVNQSIFGFSGRDPAYLVSLAHADSGFKFHSLTHNLRCHASIHSYASRFLNQAQVGPSASESRVFLSSVAGHETHIGEWIDSELPGLMKRFGILERREVGILFRGERTGRLVSPAISGKKRIYSTTPLDLDSSLWANCFRCILSAILDSRGTVFSIIEEHLGYRSTKALAIKVMAELGELRSIAELDPNLLRNHVSKFRKVASDLYPEADNLQSVSLLTSTLNTPQLLEQFRPAGTDELQLMTLHKSKGLEFDLVFHLDLYDYIMPNPLSDEAEIQLINLHYVGITRAKKACILCTSSRRTNASGEVRGANPSSYLSRHSLGSHRGAL